ncbi:MAG: tetratricopeptide (TPR) repeat protein, partial [Myxococcota bacterium]
MGALRIGWMLGLLMLSVPAQAQEADLADEAELHFQLGVDAYLARRYRAALEHLLLSNRLAPNPGVAFNIGRAYEKLGEYSRAYTYYRAAAESWEREDRRATARASIEAIRPRLALVEVTTDPPGAAVYIDRVNLGQRGTTPLIIAVEPGEHDIIVE